MYGKPISSAWHGYMGTSLYNTYDVEAMIGTGGCGSVYKAWHRRLQKHIVLKVLKDSSQKALEVRRNEVEALKNIKCMYIPQVYDYLTEENNSLTVIEYIEGESMDKLLSDGRMFSETQIIKWYYQLASALEALHQKEICHRDIKPGNVMLMKNDDVCLIDFNSALVSGNNTKVINRSAGYASPEQFSYYHMCCSVHRKMKDNSDTREAYPIRRRVKKIDWKLSDIYSLGATMYHLYTGKPPHMHCDKTAKTLMVGEAGTDISSIIERSMQPEPEMRFLSASELRATLLMIQGKYVHTITDMTIPSLTSK